MIHSPAIEERFTELVDSMGLVDDRGLDEHGHIEETVSSYTIRMMRLGFNVAVATMSGEIEKPDFLVSIPRGGMTPADHMARMLGMGARNIISLPLSHYDSEGNPTGDFKDDEPVQEVSPLLVAKKHLIVPEDVADTGGTLVKAEAVLNRMDPASLLLAAVYFKGRSAEPDFWVDKTDRPGQWVNFPTKPMDDFGDFFEAQMEMNPEDRLVTAA